MTDYPKYGTSPIRCGRTRCSWRGYETQRAQKPIEGTIASQSVCPTCGCDSYTFMTPGEVKSWRQKKAAKKAANQSVVKH